MKNFKIVNYKKQNVPLSIVYMYIYTRENRPPCRNAKIGTWKNKQRCNRKTQPHESWYHLVLVSTLYINPTFTRTELIKKHTMRLEKSINLRPWCTPLMAGMKQRNKRLDRKTWPNADQQNGDAISPAACACCYDSLSMRTKSSISDRNPRFELRRQRPIAANRTIDDNWRKCARMIMEPLTLKALADPSSSPLRGTYKKEKLHWSKPVSDT